MQSAAGDRVLTILCCMLATGSNPADWQSPAHHARPPEALSVRFPVEPAQQAWVMTQGRHFFLGGPCSQLAGTPRRQPLHKIAPGAVSESLLLLTTGV